MAADLTGVRGKIGRALLHLEEFRAAEGAWVATKPYRLREEIFTLPGSEPNRGFFVESADQVPVEVRTVVGDVLTNLRAALDHLAWQAVLDAGGVPTSKTYFPTLSDPSPNKPPPAVVVQGGVGAPVIAYMENVQPWGKSARAQSLALLKKLVNDDKHRELALVGIARAGLFLTFANGFRVRMPPEEASYGGDPSMLVAGEQVLAGAIDETGGGFNVLEVELVASICFGAGEHASGLPVGEVLAQLCDDVRAVVDDLATIMNIP